MQQQAFQYVHNNPNVYTNNNTTSPEGSRVKRPVVRLIKYILGILFFTISVVVLTKSVLFFKSILQDTGLSPSTVVKLLFGSGVPLVEKNGRTNILILGMGGENHTGSDLTDTMIILSLKHNPKAMAFVTLPRDLWSDTLQDKINSAFHYGEEKKQGGGVVLAKLIASEATGLDMHYVMRIDFSGFKEIIDLLGGIDIVVPVAFTDTQYPIIGKEADNCDGDPLLSCRYQVIHFDAGRQHMDGTSALSYVRSRHAEGAEGSDFARGRRQQDILLAIKQKIAQPEFWTDYQRVRSFTSVITQTTQTDLNIGELISIAKVVRQIGQENILRVSFESELIEPSKWQYGGRYVLVPKKTLTELHDFIGSKLN